MAPSSQRHQATGRAVIRRTRGSGRWLPNVIDPASLPVPKNRGVERRTVLRRSHRIKYRPRVVDRRTTVNYHRQEGLDKLRRDPFQLVQIYCGVRSRHASETDKTSSRSTSRSASKRSRRHLTQIAAVTGELVNDVVEAVCLQPVVQNLQDRIIAIHLIDRPVPTSLDPHVLGLELKLRLAATSPEIRCCFNRKLGTYYVRERHHGTRYVALYDIDEEDDFYLQCSLRISDNE